ncbi:MAG: hypothetical protein B7X08_02965 [Acidocella sp. 20-63-7]|nr:MAG: hypothetical protein B7X08_02965 [Acidocella sp. 20-63-7]HQT45975.1 DUF839 domain-containing protein [Acidocella sp.]
MRRRTWLGGLALAALSRSIGRAQSALGGLAPAPGSAAQTPKLDDTVSARFRRIVLARWGDAVLPDAPPFIPGALTTHAAATQFPYDGVLAGLVVPPPAQDGIARLVMVVANPTAPARMVFPDGVDAPDVAGRMQGVTVLNLQYRSGRWVTVDGGYQSRRLNDGTLCQISGPVSGRIGATVQGVLAVQAGCATPWGNTLLAEGNPAPWLSRLAGVGYGYDDPTNALRFGWVAEFNALDPGSFPVKRTALGRIARAGIAATTTADGRAVIFFSQDAPAGCFFRFIAATAATDGTALDSGTLAVARITGSGIGWVDLGSDIPTLAGLAGAAVDAGGSAFDAPGGIAISADIAAVYLACAGNVARTQADLLNPRVSDGNGHIVQFTVPGGDITAKNFAGSVVLAAGNPARDSGTRYTPGSVGWFTRPCTLSLDPAQNLWIGTDQRGAVSVTADGLFIMQTGGPSPYLISTAYLAPIGAALGGAAFDAPTGTCFAAVRHPGATPGASFDHPATRWPTLLPTMPPQTTVIGLVSN